MNRAEDFPRCNDHYDKQGRQCMLHKWHDGEHKFEDRWEELRAYCRDKHPASDVGMTAGEASELLADYERRKENAELYEWMRKYSQISIDLEDGTLKLRLGVEPNTIPSQFDAAIHAARRKFKERKVHTHFKIPEARKPNVFEDQKQFMEACGQFTDRYHERQTALYIKLIREETAETDDAVFSMFSKDIGDPAKQIAEVADGALDTIVVAIGLLYSLGLDPIPLWDEVVRSNMAKRGPDGKVHKREDGKVLKPEGWTKPDLVGLIKQQMGDTE